MGIVLAVDGNSLLHRSHHAGKRDGAEGRRDTDGAPLWAVEGLAGLLGRVIEKVKPTHLVVGFDDPASSLRRSAFPDYKGTRAEKDEDLVKSLEMAPALLASLGIHVVIPPGLEADDILASVAAKASQEGHSCVLVTSDRDALALVNEDVSVLRLMSGGLDKAQLLDPAGVEATYKVPPKSYRLYAAIRGDASDNLVGLAGAGEKTAALMAAGRSSVEDLLEAHALGEVRAPKGVLGRLEDPEVQAQLKRNERLMTTLVLEVELAPVAPVKLVPGIRLERLVMALGSTRAAPSAQPGAVGEVLKEVVSEEVSDEALNAKVDGQDSSVGALQALAQRRGWALEVPAATHPGQAERAAAVQVAAPAPSSPATPGVEGPAQARGQDWGRLVQGVDPQSVSLIANPRPEASLLSA